MKRNIYFLETIEYNGWDEKENEPNEYRYGIGYFSSVDEMKKRFKFLDAIIGNKMSITLYELNIKKNQKYLYRD